MLFPGLLTSKWSLHLWGEESVSLESWVQKEKPRTSEDKHRTQVTDNNLFEVRPRSGSLRPGESCHVTMEYVPAVRGMHRLPALLEVSKGRRALLTLVGRTLESFEKHLVVPESPFQLAPVFLGDQRPPLQSMALRNGGQSEIRYQLDTEPLTRLTQDSYGFEVLAVLNPVGCIPVGESVLLEWRFQPIEERVYEVELPLHVLGGETMVVRVRGRGTREVTFSAPPVETSGLQTGLGYDPAQTLRLPDQTATLSVESIAFGHVPELSINRRLVTVRNTSNQTVHFAWRPSLAAGSLACGRVKMELGQGTVTPGSECVCKVVLTAGTQPQIFEVRIWSREYRFWMQAVNP